VTTSVHFNSFVNSPNLQPVQSCLVLPSVQYTESMLSLQSICLIASLCRIPDLVLSWSGITSCCRSRVGIFRAFGCFLLHFKKCCLVGSFGTERKVTVVRTDIKCGLVSHVSVSVSFAKIEFFDDHHPNCLRLRRRFIRHTISFRRR
jgi:hypothetical protein